MQSSTVIITNDKEQLLNIKLCTRATKEQQTVFNALSYKHRPFVRKIKIETQMLKQKHNTLLNNHLRCRFFMLG